MSAADAAFERFHNMDVDATFLSAKYASQIVTEAEMYLRGFNDGADAVPPQMGAYPIYRAGWIDGVESHA